MFRPKLWAASQVKHIDLKDRGSSDIREVGSDKSLFIKTVKDSFKFVQGLRQEHSIFY